MSSDDPRLPRRVCRQEIRDAFREHQFAERLALGELRRLNHPTSHNIFVYLRAEDNTRVAVVHFDPRESASGRDDPKALRLDGEEVVYDPSRDHVIPCPYCLNRGYPWAALPPRPRG